MFVERIEKFNPELNAFCYLDLEGARTRAAAIDAAVARGARSRDRGRAYPMGVKELVQVAGWPDTHASLLYRDDVGHARRHRAGAAQARGGRARRPHDLARVRFDQLDPHVSARHDPQPVESGTHARRFVGRIGGGGGVGDDADLHRQRRRRLDPHPVGVQRSVRLQDELRSGRRTPATSTARSRRCPVRCAARFATRPATSTRSRARPTTTPRRCRCPSRSYEDAIVSGDAVAQLRGKRAAWSSTLGFAVCDPEVEKLAYEAALALCADAGHRARRRRRALAASGRGVGIDLVARHRGQPSRRGSRSLGRRHAGVACRLQAVDRINSEQLMRSLRRRFELLAAIGGGLRRGRPVAHADDRDDRVRRRGSAAARDRRAEGRRHGLGAVHRAVQHLRHARRQHPGRHRVRRSARRSAGGRPPRRRGGRVGVRRGRRSEPPWPKLAPLAYT